MKLIYIVILVIGAHARIFGPLLFQNPGCELKKIERFRLQMKYNYLHNDQKSGSNLNLFSLIT